MSTWRRLRGREVDATAFTPVLDGLLKDLPDALCATFLDAEGETIDLATRLDVFDARVIAAEFALPLAHARALTNRMGAGPILELRVGFARRSAVLRHVADDCDLLVVFDVATVGVRDVERVARAARSLCVETGMTPIAALSVLRNVELGPDGLTPRTFEEAGIRRRVRAVLGMFEGPGHTQFLVHTDAGEDVMVRLDHATRLWRRE